MAIATHYAVTPIGVVSVYDGQDNYVLVTNKDGDVDLESIEQEFLEECYYDSNVPGSRFCHRVTAVALPNSNQCIVIIHNRIDI